MLSKYVPVALICLFGILMSTSAISAQDESDSLFTLYSEDPVAPRGIYTDWYSAWNEPAGIVVFEDQFYLFWNGSGSSDIKGVGYRLSDDGYEWEVISQEAPAFTSDDVEYAGYTIAGSSVLINDEGEWLSYFYTKDIRQFPAGGGDISRAVADGPDGPWVIADEVLLARGAEGEWDSEQVSYPEVIQTEDGYVMYYSGFAPRSGGIAIGMATSEDGVNWVQYDDPETTEAPYADSDPIIVGEEGENATMPNVVMTPNGWIMIYKDDTLGNILLATSTDSINWERQDQPVITLDDIPSARAIGFMNLLYHDEIFYLYLEVGTLGSNTSIYLATYDGVISAD